MVVRAAAALLFFLFLPNGCSHAGSPQGARTGTHYIGPEPQVLAVYEAWFGHPSHIKISYNSHDPAVIRKQMRDAKKFGITGFVVDWYGYRQPFEDVSYALMQSIAAEENFHIAMMYDETDDDEGATDEALEDFKLFNKKYLAATAAGRQAYLTYNGRPVIFIFPKGEHTDWDRVRAEVNKWNPAPVLIEENLPGNYAADFDGFYAWVQPGKGGWAADGSNWGKDYLDDFYRTMQTKYPDKFVVGGAWSSFDDSKASWGLNRHISPRCGQTFQDTFKFWRQYDISMPFLLVETWNDYEEGTAVETGIPSCPANAPETAAPPAAAAAH